MRSRAARFVARLLPVAAALAGTTLLIFSHVHYESIKAYMDALSFDGDAYTFSRHLFTTLAFSARLTGGILLVAALVLVGFQSRVERALAVLIVNTIEYLRRTAGDAARTLRQESRQHRTALLAIIAFGIALRIRPLGQPINYDESFTYIVYANRPWLIAWANYSEPNNHLFHTLLAHLSIGVFGNAVWAIRLPALIAGCLTIPLAYALARRLAGRNEALLVAALVAASQVLIAFSVCARGYTLLIDLFLLAVVAGHDIITTRSPHAWPVLVVACALGFFTIPAFLYPYLSVLTWLFLAGRRDPENGALRWPMLTRSAAWTLALVAVCYAPAFVTSGLQAGINYARGTVPMLAFMATLWGRLQDVWFDMMRGLPNAVTAVLAMCAAIGARRLWRTHAGGILLVPLVLWPALTVLAQRVLAPARVWIYLLPVFFVYAAAGAMEIVAWIAARVPRWSTALPAAATGVMAMAISVQAVTHLPVQYTEWNNAIEIYAHTDLDQVANYLKTSLADRDALFAAPFLDYPLEYYLRVHGVPIAFLRRPPTDPERVILLANDTLHQSIAKVMTTNGFDPERGRPRLVRSFTYSSLYEIQRQRGGQ